MGLPIDMDWLRENGRNVDWEKLDRLMAKTTAAAVSWAPGPWEVPVEGWTPTPLNKLLGVHWGTRSSRKRRDREAVCAAVADLALRGIRVPPASGKRRVSLRVTLTKGKRRTDVDSLQKTTLDACKEAGLIRDDSEDWCEWGNVAYDRGESLRTIILVEDV